MSATEDLRKTLGYIDKHGNVKGQLWTLGGRVCVEGAMRRQHFSGGRRRAVHNLVGRKTRYVDGIDANDSGGLGALRRLAGKGVKHQKAEQQAQAPKETAKQRRARQQPCVVSGGSGSRAGVRGKLSLVAIVVAALLAWHFAALLMMVLHIALLVGLIAAVLWGGYAFGIPTWEWVEEQNWAYVSVWLAKRREARQVQAAQVAQVDQRRSDWLAAVPEREPIALGTAPSVTVDQVLAADWLEPEKIKDVVGR